MAKTLIVLVLLCTPVLPGQSVTAQDASPTRPPVPSLQTLLDRLFAYAAAYRATLPSLECRETITAERVNKGNVTWTVHMQTIFQVMPDPARPGEFFERRKFTAVDGKPPKKKWKIPYFVNSGFANVIGFGHPEQRQCFDYALTPAGDGAQLRLEMAAKPGVSAAGCSDVLPSYRKVVLICADPVRIVRVERWLSAEDAKKYREPFYYTMEFGARSFGAQTLWLPVKAESHNARDDGRMEIEFSDYHRYTSEVRILPGEEPEVSEP